MFKKTVLWLLVLIWMSVMFTFSSEDVKTSQSKSTEVVKVIEKVTTQKSETISSAPKPKGAAAIKNFKFKEFVVRKSAHFTEYFILSLLLLIALSRSGVRGIWRCFIALAISVVFAAMDEYHQLFVQGREGRLRDVFIDSSGAITAIIIFLLIKKCVRTSIISRVKQSKA